VNRIRELRTKNNYTLKKLAELLNMSYSNIAMIEREERSMTQENIQLFANFFNVSADYLLGRSDIPNPEEIKKEPELSEFQFALYGEVKDLSNNQKDEILRLVKSYKNLLEEDKKGK